MAITQEQVADHLDLSSQRLRMLMSQGRLPTWNRETATYDMYRVAYIRWLQVSAARHKSQDGNLDLTAERAKLTRAQTEKTQLEVSRLKGESLARLLVAEVWQTHTALVRSRFSGLASTLRLMLPKLDTDDVDLIDGVVCEILEELANKGLPECG